MVDVAVEDIPRDLRPIVRDNTYQIAAEALRNAFRHAQARHIEVEIRYKDKQLQLRVRDDGSGMDLKNFEGRKPGHFGIPGMRERADLTGGHLEIWSKVGLGTEVNLIVLGDLARPAPGVRSPPGVSRQNEHALMSARTR